MCGHRRVMQAITLAGHDVAKVAISASCARELAVLNSNGPPMVFTSSPSASGGTRHEDWNWNRCDRRDGCGMYGKQQQRP
jgi:hypothetical protein